MKAIDRRAIEGLGIIGPILMENAGLQIAMEMLDCFPEINGENIVIVAGRGNNGGDGFVVARHLYNQGCRPHVILLARMKDLKGDAALNAGIAQRIGVEISEAPGAKEWRVHKKALKKATLLVDALFGTGLTHPAKGFFAQVIDDINVSEAFKIAVDIPSGLSSDSYQISGPCVEADLTITLAAPKIAHVFPPAEEMVGDLVVADISIPPELFDDDQLRLELVEKERVAPYFRPRKRDAHKGNYGHLFILSGSLGKTGASILAGKAALKMGAGLVTLGTPQSCLPIVARAMAELMTEPLPETTKKTFSADAIERTIELLKDKDALLLGPGISTHPSTAEFVYSLLPKVKIPVVLDADALNILAENMGLLKSLKKTAVVTPHPGEFARLLNLSTKDVVEKKLELGPQFAREYGVILVLKGYRTLICAPDGKTSINPTGNPGMATAGSGDVLSGMIASMIMQEEDPLLATLAAVYVHGLSGDIGVQKIGEKALTAGKLISCLPEAIKSMTAFA